MSVPRIQPVSRTQWPYALLLLFSVCLPAAAKGPEPPQRIQLTSLGWQPPAPNVLAAGGSLTTVHFIDEQHLLVTFGVRRLMKRLPDEPPDDADRTIEAVVVHLPSGKVLARTSWRVHDMGQYLWSLGQGRFLLRIRNTLTTFTPLANLAHGDAFAEQPFLLAKRTVVAVLVSAERDLVTVETVDPPPPRLPGDPDPPPPSGLPKPTQINFYRVIPPAEPTDRVVVQSAGVAVAKGPVNISLSSAGYIEVLKESASRWLFDFDSYGGTYTELSPFDSTCRPQTVFVSASEFVAFGCRGSADRQSVGGFNMRGEQMWQQDFTDAHAFPNFAFAPMNGRFALSRNIVSAGAGITVEFAPSAFTTQEIRVYQMHNGRQLLRVEAGPVQRTGQNYDLSPAGLRLVVLRNDAAEVYRLPGLSREDEAAIHAAKALAPENSRLAVNLSSHIKPKAAKSEAGPEVLATKAVKARPADADVALSPIATPQAAPETPSPETPAADTAGNASAGDDAPRKPPTLYTLPNDKVNKPDKPQ